MQSGSSLRAAKKRKKETSRRHMGQLLRPRRCRCLAHAVTGIVPRQRRQRRHRRRRRAARWPPPTVHVLVRVQPSSLYTSAHFRYLVSHFWQHFGRELTLANAATFVCRVRGFTAAPPPLPGRHCHRESQHDIHRPHRRRHSWRPSHALTISTPFVCACAQISHVNEACCSLEPQYAHARRTLTPI